MIPPQLGRRGRPGIARRPSPTCRRVIPIKRVHPASARVHHWRAHQEEVVPVPEGDGRYSEIPVLGVAR